MSILRELKAKKARYGFALDGIGLANIIPLGKLLESLHNMGADKDCTKELVGMNQRDFRLYTDDASLAEWIRSNWLQKL